MYSTDIQPASSICACVSYDLQLLQGCMNGMCSPATAWPGFYIPFIFLFLPGTIRPAVHLESSKSIFM